MPNVPYPATAQMMCAGRDALLKHIADPDIEMSQDVYKAMIAAAPKPESAAQVVKLNGGAPDEGGSGSTPDVPVAADLISAIEELMANSEEFDADYGMGRGAPQEYWDSVEHIMEHHYRPPAPPSGEPENKQEAAWNEGFFDAVDASTKGEPVAAQPDGKSVGTETGTMPQPVMPLSRNIEWAQAEIDQGETVWGLGDIDRGFQNMGMEINRLRQAKLSIARTNIIDGQKLAQAISRDCNNTALERNALQSQLSKVRAETIEMCATVCDEIVEHFAPAEGGLLYQTREAQQYAVKKAATAIRKIEG